MNDTIKDWSNEKDIESVMDILVKEVESLPDNDPPDVPLTNVIIKELNRSYQYFNKGARDDNGKLKVSWDCNLIEKFPEIVKMSDLSLAKNEDKMLGEVFTESVQSIRGRQAQQPQKAVGDTTRERGGIHANPKVEKNQREYYLNEQMKAIQKWDVLERKIQKAGMSEEEQHKCMSELEKLRGRPMIAPSWAYEAMMQALFPPLNPSPGGKSEEPDEHDGVEEPRGPGR